ncbi:MAG TPA: DUF6796 family protein [Chitinophagales bacterium]|nr:DUF6796 family protein [Chitinophagales bacterium]
MGKTAAYIGIAGALGMAACDMILLAQPVAGWNYGLSSFEAMALTPPLRVFIGSTFGLVCAFFICFGFWYLKELFEGVERQSALWLFVALCSVEFFGGAFHAGYYFISAAVTTNTGSGAPLAMAIVQEYTHHLEIISYLGVPGFLAGAILFFKLALDKRFPKWFKFANPLISCGVFMAVFSALPAPFGGYLKPTFINMGLAAMLALSVRFWPKAA